MILLSKIFSMAIFLFPFFLLWKVISISRKTEKNVREIARHCNTLKDIRLDLNKVEDKLFDVENNLREKSYINEQLKTIPVNYKKTKPFALSESQLWEKEKKEQKENADKH